MSFPITFPGLPLGLTRRSLASVAFLGLVPCAGSATTLISDNFNSLASGAGLNGRTPDGAGFVNSVNTSGWVTNSTLLAGNGSGGLTATTSAARFFSIDLGASYFSSNPGVYQLSVDLATPLNGTATGNVQLGFSPSISTNASFITNNGAPWLSYSGTGEVIVSAGPGAANQFSTTAATGVTHTFMLQLDTTGGQWTLNAFIDGLGLDLNGAAAGNAFTYTTNPITDRYIALSSSGTSGTQGTMTVDNFQFALVPEPGSAGLALLGTILLVLRRKRSEGAVP